MSRIRPILEELTAPGQLFEVVADTMYGRPVRTYANRPRNLRDLFGFRFAHGDLPYLIQGDARHSFAETFDRSLRLAAGLRDRFAVQPGDRIAVIGANAPEWVMAYWAIVALQGVVVPFNAWWTPEELGFGLADSGTRVVVADSRRAPRLVKAGFDPDRVVVWGDGEIPAGSRRFEQFLAGTPLDEGQIPPRGEDEVAAIFYTSGTTGRPKGSANTHRNILSNLMSAGVFLAAVRVFHGEPPTGIDKDVNLCVVPLFHATANFTYLVPYVFAGNALVFLPPGRFDPEEAGRIIERERVTTFGGVPTVVARMLDEAVHLRHDFSSVVSIGYGGAPCAPALLERIGDAFPSLRDRVGQGYGLTETSAIATVNAGPDYADRPGSVGLPAPVVDLRIVDADGTDLPPGCVGEICIWGPNVIEGYWNRPDDNRRSFLDGYLRSGDLGYVDDDGFVYVTDRAKDLIIRGGENISSVEVEAVLEQYPAVLEAAVVGVPHPAWGEEVKAIVVAREGSQPTEEELSSFAGLHLAPFKVPSHWEITTERLPRNPSGKVLKPVLRGDRVAAVGGDDDSTL